MTRDYTILTVNPGSTGTKIGVVKGGKVVLDNSADNLQGEFDHCETFAEQVPFREKKIIDLLDSEGIDLDSIDAVSGRGVGIRSCVGGTYQINDLAYDHALRDVENIHHPATLGIVIAYQLGKHFGKPSYFVNPINTDELCDVARMTGVKGLYRPARSHPLNQKQVAIHHSKLHGTQYEDQNYIVLHLGGGVSITAHCHGKAIDSTRAGDGQGAISPNRSGDLCAGDVFTLLDRGMKIEEIKDLCSRQGGLQNLTGTDDVRKIIDEMIPAGNAAAKIAFDAMVYSMVKWTATMAGALKGEVDAILLTGGLANAKGLVQRINESCSWIAPVYVYPGSFETEALASGAERVLSGEESARVYTGKPAWSGFGFEDWEGKKSRD